MDAEIKPKDQIVSQDSVTKIKTNRIKWWQATLILLFTLGFSLSVGYFISDKYLWDNKDTAQLEKRLEHYKQQVDLKPNDPELRVQLGYAFFLKDKFNDAIEQYKTAISLDKNFYPSYLNLAIVYDKQNKPQDSLEMASKAAKLAPRDYKGHLLKGIAYRKLKMYDKANESLQEALNFMSTNTDIIYEIGQVAQAQGKVKEAEQIYKEALSFDPLYRPALDALDLLASNDSKK
ncbi:tetratricopeptide repeat protein [Pseudoneobacillus sp. C159]